MARQTFKPRILVTFLMVLGFLTGAGSGIVLYATPRGRVANWSGWSFIDLTRDEWMNLHLVTGLMFLVAGLFHLWFNWKPLKAFFWSRAAQTLNRRWEMFLAVVLTGFVVVGSIQVLPPIDKILALREWARDGMMAPDSAYPPTLQGPSREAGPQAPESHPSETGRGGGYGGGESGGFGRMTVRDVATHLGLDYESVRRRLAARDIAFADHEPLRDIAARYGMRPGEFGRLLEER